MKIVKSNLKKDDVTVFIHGGPGLEHSYLVPAFEFMSEVSDLVFYDQLGSAQDYSGNVSDISIQDLVDQLIEVLEKLNGYKRINIVAHSWGAFLVYATLSRSNFVLKIERLFLISPIGLTYSSFEQSGKRLIERIPQNQLEKIETIENRDPTGVDLMMFLMPYYLHNKSISSEISFKSYSSEVNEYISGLISGYDFTEAEMKVPKTTVLVYGESDIVEEDETSLLHSSCEVSLVSKSSHFSFYENPAEFSEIILSKF